MGVVDVPRVTPAALLATPVPRTPDHVVPARWGMMVLIPVVPAPNLRAALAVGAVRLVYVRKHPGVVWVPDRPAVLSERADVPILLSMIVVLSVLLVVCNFTSERVIAELQAGSVCVFLFWLLLLLRLLLWLLFFPCPSGLEGTL